MTMTLFGSLMQDLAILICFMLGAGTVVAILMGLGALVRRALR
jgi:hypothetical protein